MTIKNMTELQKEIKDVIAGYPVSEAIHALEIIKLDLFLCNHHECHKLSEVE